MKYLLFITAIILFTSCSSYKQMTVKCNKTTLEIFKELTIALTEENFIIVKHDVELGFLYAERDDSDVWIGPRIKKWNFTVKNDSIIAKGFEHFPETNSNNYIGDKNQPTETWYWNIKNKLENICDNKAILYK